MASKSASSLASSRTGVRKMLLIINGEEHNVPDRLTVVELLLHLGVTGPVAVERNREILPRAEHPVVYLAEGDALEIVHFVGGG